MVKTFLQWAEEEKKELPLFSANEDRIRGGIAHWAYPDAYVRSQYPDSYFLPHAADALYKLGKKKKKKK
jgi:hypothetical protein